VSGVFRRWWPLLLLLVVPVLAFPGALPGPRVVSADDHLTVHHAFQDEAGGRVRHPTLSDPALQFKALRRRVVDDLSHGRAPLWNPDILGGTELLGDGQSMPASPVTLAHLVFQEDTAQDVGVAFVLLWTGLGLALLAAALGAGPWAALAAGVAAMTGPVPFVWLLHPHAATFAWLPWLLLAIERRSAVLAALVTLGLLCGGHPGTMVHALGIAAVWWALRARSPRVALGVLAGGLLAGPVIGPLIEAAMASVTVGARGHTPLHPQQLLDLVWPGALGHPAADGYTGPGAWADGQVHPGLAALALAVYGALRDPRARWLVGGWALCLALALAPLPGPFDHGRLAQVGALLMAIGAGLGVAELRRPSLRVGAVLAVLATGLWARHLDQGSLPADQHDPAPAAWTEALVAATGCESAATCGRVLGLTWALQPNTGALAGLRDVRGYDLPVYAGTWALQNALSRPARGPWFQVDTLPPLGLLRALGVRAVVTPPDMVLELPAVDVGPAPVAVWSIEGAAPRAFVANGVHQVRDARSALEALGDGGGLDAAVQVVPVERDLAVPSGEGRAGTPAPVPFVEDGPARLTFDVSGHPAGLLVLSESWRSGWRSRVDGKPSPVERVGGVLCGVVLPEGATQVTVFYRPDGWIWGQRTFFVGLGLLGCVAGFGLLLGRRRRADPTPAVLRDG
jgi:hypothetical protein